MEPGRRSQSRRLNRFTLVDSVGVFLLFFIPLTFCPRLLYGYLVPKLWLVALGSVIFVTFWLIQCNGTIKLTLSSDTVIIAVYLFYTILRHLFIQDGYSTDFFLSIVPLYFFLFKSVSFNSKQYTLILLTLCFVALLESVYIYIQFFKLDPFYQTPYSSIKLRLVGTMGNANGVGAFLSIIFPFLLFLYSRQKLWLWKRIISAAVVVVFLAIIITQSRAAWLGLVAGFSVLFFPEIKKLWQSKGLRKIFIILIPIGLGAVFAVYSLNKTSIWGRLYIWRISWEMIRDFPFFGVGFGRFGYYFSEYQAAFLTQEHAQWLLRPAAVVTYAHNQFLDIWAEFGTLGIVLFLAVLYFFIRLIHIGLSEKNRHAAAALVVFSVICFVDSPLRMPAVYFIFIFVITLLSHQMNTEYIKHKDWRFILPKFPRILLISVGVFLIFRLLLYIHSDYTGYRRWKAGIYHVNRLNWDEAVKNYRMALNVLPNNGELCFHLGAAMVHTAPPDSAIYYLYLAMKNFRDENLYLSLGKAYQLKGSYEHAEDAYRQALHLYADRILPHLLLAQLYREQGENRRAEKELTLLLNMSPKANPRMELLRTRARLMLQQIKNE
ncbi:O-antigen ligase family protein [candidate division KSB1 bacterium]|nr:O-antigen ligase family protein [candidate division KSB1 bacterium]